MAVRSESPAIRAIPVVTINLYRVIEFPPGGKSYSIGASLEKRLVKSDGFDLFEDIDEFFKGHPEDRQWCDKPDTPYFEFRSGQHSLDSVTAKLSAIQPLDGVALVPGDSTKTVRANLPADSGCRLHFYRRIPRLRSCAGRLAERAAPHSEESSPGDRI